MGTMLAQKKPLESIQRSQAINFVAEIFYDELQFILDRRLLDHTMVNCHGMNSRVKSRDVLSVSVQHIAATNADKEYILLIWQETASTINCRNYYFIHWCLAHRA